MAHHLNNEKEVLFKIDANYRLGIALLIAAVIFFLTRTHISTPSLILVTWLGFALTIIFMDWIIILTSHPQEVRRIAKIQDSSRLAIIAFTLTACIASMGSIYFLLKESKGAPHHKDEHILLAIGAVVISWWLVHTIFTLLYAHLFYDTDTDEGKPLKVGGLDFPGGKDPDYLDFVYFSFVIGMTFQVSDVQIENRLIRRIALIHALIAFAFNTAILALSMNVISGLVSQ